jgi:hypothetical protein
MNPIDALWHLLNFLAPALFVAGLSTLGAALIWRGRHSAQAWLRIALKLSSLDALSLLAALFLTRHDGTMVGYAALLLVNAAGLGWLGLRTARR